MKIVSTVLVWLYMYAVILMICEISLDSILLSIDFVLGIIGRMCDIY